MYRKNAYANLSDEELLEQYRTRGDRSAIGHLFKRHLERVLGICLYYLKDEAASEDAAMDIFEIVLRTAARQQITHPYAWLYQVSRNHCLKKISDSLKMRLVDLQEIDEALGVEFDNKDTLLNRERQLDQLSEAIDELKNEQRLCVIYFFLQSKSYKEIEQITPFTRKEIKSHLQNGKRNLKKAMQKAMGSRGQS